MDIWKARDDVLRIGKKGKKEEGEIGYSTRIGKKLSQVSILKIDELFDLLLLSKYQEIQTDRQGLRVEQR